MEFTMSNVEKSVFALHDTAVVKAAAVVLLLCHHLYMGVLPAPMSVTGNPPLLVFSTLAKVCVAVFTLLSGYGLTISYEHRKGSVLEFQKNHLLGLMKPFWLIYAVFFVLSAFLAREGFTPIELYGTGVKGLLRALSEIFALRPILGTPTINQTWWYVEAALVLYICFPLLWYLTKRVPYLILPISAVPLVLYAVMGNNVWDTCREIYWFFPFCAGIFMAQRGLLDRFSAFCDVHRARAVAIALPLIIVAAFVRAKIGLAVDTFFAVTIVLFIRAAVSSIPAIGTALAFVGRHSADIFYTHSFFYSYFFTQKYFVRWFLWQESLARQLAALPTLLAVSLAAAVLLDCVRKVLRAK